MMMKQTIAIYDDGIQIRLTEPNESRSGDETYSHPTTGTHNVTMIMRGINDGSIPREGIIFPIDETWRRVAAEADINPERLALVTEEEVRANPLLILEYEPQWCVCADGAHRLRWMVDHGYVEARGIKVQISDIEHCRILAEESRDDGKTWTPVDTQRVIDSMLGKFPMYEKGVRKFYPNVKPQRSNMERPERQCGNCTMCCKLFAIEEFNKPVDKWCAHCAVGKGCKIYDSRPQACRDFSCLWLEGAIPEEMKPSKIKAVFWMPEGQQHVQINVDIGRTWEGTAVESVARTIAGKGVHVCVVQGSRRRFYKGEGQPLPQNFEVQEVTR